MSGDREVINSSHWGGFLAHVQGGEVVETRALPGDSDPSPLVSSIADGLTSDARVRSPAVRRGWLEGGPGAARDRRGAETFVRVSWDRALDLVAAELNRVKEDFGNAAIFGGSYGWSSAGRFHHAKTQLSRFLNSFGGCTAQTGNYSYAAASAILPHVLGTDLATRGEATTWDSIAGTTELWVMFGGAPLKNAQVEAGGTVGHAASAGLRRLRDAGTEFVGITPLRDDLPEFLNAEWLAPRPNTDTALMLGLAHTLLVEEMHDEDFLARYCVGWDRLRDYIVGASDGQPKDAAWAADITGLHPDAIRRLARRMGTRRTLISATWSLQRADHGEQPFWMTVALACMLGQIGLPGGGFGFAYGDAAGIGSPKSPLGTPTLPTGRNPTGSAVPVARICDMLLHPGVEYDFNGERRTWPDIRLIYWAGGNPFHHHQDINRMVGAWQRPETVVVHDPWWTATARHADIVLPATTTLERNDIGAGARDAHLVAMQQALPPVGGARNDYDIFAALAHRLGTAPAFTEGRDEMQWLRKMYDTFRAGADAAGARLPDFDEFWAEGILRLPAGAKCVLLSDFRDDPDANPLGTPSGRIELYSETVAGFGYDDCPGHPMWIEPREWLGSPRAATYPLHLISNQPKTRLHSQLDMGRVSQAAKVKGREAARIHPAEGARRGLSDGAVARLFNERGSCLVGVLLDSQVRLGVVQLSTGAWYDPLEPGKSGSMDKHGNPNVLTADHGTSKLGQGPSAHTALVEIEPYEEEPPPLTAFRRPTVEEAPTSTRARVDRADS